MFTHNRRPGRFALLLVLSATWLGCGRQSRPTVDTIATESALPLSADLPLELRTPVEQLRATDPLARAAAARQLRASGPAAAACGVYLRAALADPYWEVRADAAQALGASGDRGAVTPLIERLEQDEVWSVRARAAAALGVLRDRRATPALRAALADMACFVRRAAAVALGEMADPAAAEALAVTAQCDSDATVREAAKRALERCTAANMGPRKTNHYEFANPKLEIRNPKPMRATNISRALSPTFALLSPCQEKGRKSS